MDVGFFVWIATDKVSQISGASGDLEVEMVERALVHSTIAGLITKINVVGLGKYPRAGPRFNNKLKTLPTSSNITQPQHCLFTTDVYS